MILSLHKPPCNRNCSITAFSDFSAPQAPPCLSEKSHAYFLFEFKQFKIQLISEKKVMRNLTFKIYFQAQIPIWATMLILLFFHWAISACLWTEFIGLCPCCCILTHSIFCKADALIWLRNQNRYFQPERFHLLNPQGNLTLYCGFLTVLITIRIVMLGINFYRLVHWLIWMITQLSHSRK